MKGSWKVGKADETWFMLKYRDPDAPADAPPASVWIKLSELASLGVGHVGLTSGTTYHGVPYACEKALRCALKTHLGHTFVREDDLVVPAAETVPEAENQGSM